MGLLDSLKPVGQMAALSLCFVEALGVWKYFLDKFEGREIVKLFRRNHLKSVLRILFSLKLYKIAS